MAKRWSDEQKAHAEKINGGLYHVTLANAKGRVEMEFKGAMTKDFAYHLLGTMVEQQTGKKMPAREDSR